MAPAVECKTSEPHLLPRLNRADSFAFHLPEEDELSVLRRVVSVSGTPRARTTIMLQVASILYKHQASNGGNVELALLGPDSVIERWAWELVSRHCSEPELRGTSEDSLCDLEAFIKHFWTPWWEEVACWLRAGSGPRPPPPSSPPSFASVVLAPAKPSGLAPVPTVAPGSRPSTPAREPAVEAPPPPKSSRLADTPSRTVQLKHFADADLVHPEDYGNPARIKEALNRILGAPQDVLDRAKRVSPVSDKGNVFIEFHTLQDAALFLKNKGGYGSSGQAVGWATYTRLSVFFFHANKEWQKKSRTTPAFQAAKATRLATLRERAQALRQRWREQAGQHVADSRSAASPPSPVPGMDVDGSDL